MIMLSRMFEFSVGGDSGDGQQQPPARVVPHAHNQKLPGWPQDQDSGQNGQTAEHEALWVSDQERDMIGQTTEHEELWDIWVGHLDRDLIG